MTEEFTGGIRTLESLSSLSHCVVYFDYYLVTEPFIDSHLFSLFSYSQVLRK